MSSGHYCDGCAQAYYKCVCNKPQEKVKEQTIKMNERIRELVKQAGGHISMRNLASNPVQHIESVELWDDRIEKFAELIVRECMNAVCDPSTTHLESMTDASAMYTARERIRKHFRS